MSIDSTLLSLFQELMESYDSDIDTSVGSQFYLEVISPLLTRIGGSPLEVDLEEFVKQILDDTGLGFDTTEFSGIRDLVVRAIIPILQPYQREIAAIKLVQSLQNYEQMTRDEVNALLANYFVGLAEGTKTSGPVRVYYSSPRTVQVTSLTPFSTGSGLNFYPTATQSVSSTAMAFQQEGSLYYAEFTIEAEEAGTAYEVEAGAINAVSGLSGVVKVRNPYALTAATDDETKAEGVARAEDSITQRNLVTERGVRFVISQTFPAFSTIQVIGSGDDEMVRDIIHGPADISGVPGGLRGKEDPAIGAGARVHVKGITDVYLYDPDPIEDTLDIENIADWGVRLYAGRHGYTEAGGVPVVTFRDNYGMFIYRDVRAGDWLRIGGDLIRIDTVGQRQLELADPLEPGLYEQTYEIVRKTVGVVDIPLYDLVAVDSDGVPVTDDDDNPVQASPGDLDVGALLVGGSYVTKTDNICSANIALPLLRVSGVAVLNALTLEEGDAISWAECLLQHAEGAFSGGDATTRASGTARLYYADPVSVWARRTAARFVAGSWVYRPVAEASGSAVVPGAGSVIVLLGVNLEGVLTAGMRLGYRGSYYAVVSAADSGADTEVTVREAFASSSTGTYAIHKGISQAAMLAQGTVNGLYYFDIELEAISVGAGGNIADDTEFDSVTQVLAEGWLLRTDNEATSYSTRELPYLRLSDWVNDDLNVGHVEQDHSIRVTYEYSSTISEVQDYVESPTQRVTGEDVLVKAYRPAYVRGSFSVRDISKADALAACSDHINEKNPETALEVSDLIGALYDEGCTKVTSPVTLIGLAQQGDRTWSAIVSQDTLGYSRIQHFVSDLSEDDFTLLAAE